MTTRLAVWIVFLTVVLGLAWLKGRENTLDRDAHEAWLNSIQQIALESRPEYDRLNEWRQNLDNDVAPRRVIEETLNEGRPLQWRRKGEFEEARWIHPHYGFLLEFTLSGERLVSSGSTWGSADGSKIHPEPETVRFTSRLEAIRDYAAKLLLPAWLVAILLAVVSRRYGMLFAKISLAWAIAYAAAWLVTPTHTVTLQGILSNDRLAFAALMLLLSIVCTADRVPAESRVTLRAEVFQFRLRTLFFFTALIGLALALGPVGYVALAALAIGSLIFLALVLSLPRGILPSLDSHPKTSASGLPPSHPLSEVAN